MQQGGSAATRQSTAACWSIAELKERPSVAPAVDCPHAICGSGSSTNSWWRCLRSSQNTTSSRPASPAAHVGHELTATGMLILAGGGSGVSLDNRELERWTRVGCTARNAVKARRAVRRVRAARGYCVQIVDSGEVVLARPSGGSPYASWIVRSRV